MYFNFTFFMKVKYITCLLISLLSVLAVGCEPSASYTPEDYTEREPQTIIFNNAQFSYMGDVMGDESFDGWLVKFYTDMEIDLVGNPIGPGCVMQLLLNVDCNKVQKPNAEFLEGIYISQQNSGDYSPNTFVWGFMDYIDLPGGRIELADATFYADIEEGQTEMDVDLIDDGAIEIVPNKDGTYTFEGILVGKKCVKRHFSWRGEVDAKSYVTTPTPNSTIVEDVTLSAMTQMLIRDVGDCFYVGNESYRCFEMFLASESIGFEWGKPVGSGQVLRLDVLVPWGSKIEDGVPEGVYEFITRNADTSIDKNSLVPFSAIPGLPNRFTAPYWSGCWYVEYNEGAWSDDYARIDSGSLRIERREDGAHRVVAALLDCSEPAHTVSIDVVIENENLLIY